MIKNKYILTLIIVSVFFPFLLYLLNLYTDWLFFVETGFSSVFTTTLYAKTVAGLLFGGLLFLCLWINLYYANRAQFPLSGIYIVGGSNLRISRDEAVRFIKPVSMLASLVLALFAGNWGATKWDELLLFANKLTVGIVDPVSGG